MNAMKDKWFSEINDLWPGQCMSLKVDKVLHEEKSDYQDIAVLDTTNHGRALILDGIIQCTERDEFAYQEMIAFVPLCIHHNPKKVLIVGGGDGGVAREVAKHPLVEEIHQVEIDAKVIELSKKYLRFMAQGFESSKLQIHVGDGFEFMKNRQGEFDVIITDSSDPVGPAISLFQESYFELMRTALRPNGVICSQGGTIWNNLDHVQATLQHCKKQFGKVAYCTTSVPTYPSGQIGFIIGTLNTDSDLSTPVISFSEEECDDMKLRYYSTDVHKASFILPRFVKKELKRCL